MQRVNPFEVAMEKSERSCEPECTVPDTFSGTGRKEAERPGNAILPSSLQQVVLKSAATSLSALYRAWS